ncbi:hypothetical protein NC652_030856 [Populus alba x Populus x berolinensis]|nr:hypothetical protein NC652_030856 [Populus alba x Populus x berolinensis]
MEVAKSEVEKVAGDGFELVKFSREESVSLASFLALGEKLRAKEMNHLSSQNLQQQEYFQDSKQYLSGGLKLPREAPWILKIAEVDFC